MTTFMKDGVDIYMPEMDRTAELKMERFAEFMDKFPSISRNIFATSRHQSGATKPRGDCGVTAKKELVEILEFTHFFEHYTFGETDWSHRGEHLEKYIRVVVAVELVTVTAKPE